jgi:5-oxoprolinase (ATP-hydrolysing) subunit A
MFSIDINCDMGEETCNDELIMPFISSASIACGYHAGNEKTMKETIELCIEYDVAIGAHPSFPDKLNFGRTEMDLSYAAIYGLVTDQLISIAKIAKAAETSLHHVKPHGALYNMAAKDVVMAGTIARAVHDFDRSLILYGLAGSFSISEAKKIGLKTYSETFADRTYQDDGSLTPRKKDNALIDETGKSVAQVLQMIQEKRVTTLSGLTIPITAETICIHGDGKNAVELAKAIHKTLRENNIDSKA